MKNFIFFAISLFFLASCQTQDKNQATASIQTGTKIEVIDFHTTHRCKTCLKIEGNTKSLLDSIFKEEMDAGLLSFRLINIDEEANFAIAEHFQAAGSALFINVIKEGKEKHIDLTDFAFMKAFNDDEFNTELKSKIEAQLKTL